MESFQGLIRNKSVFHSNLFNEQDDQYHQRQLYIAVDKQLPAKHEVSEKDIIQIV